METTSRTQSSSWLRRTSWKLGSMLGAIAKRLAAPSIPISAVILARTQSMAVHPQQPLEDVAQMFVANRATELPVIERGVALGVVTRNAVGETLEHGGPHTPVGLVALSDVVVVEPNALLDDVLAELEGHPGAVALVLDHGSPLGMVTRSELDAYLEKRTA
jgi:predicted transcriptional regulator